MLYILDSHFLRRRAFIFAWAAAWLAAVAGRGDDYGGLRNVSPASADMLQSRLEGVKEIVERGLRQKRMPGCVVCVGRRGSIVYHQAFGSKQLAPQTRPMTVDTVFDMASITKPVVTATCVMKLVEDGRLRLGDRISKHLPKFDAEGKGRITIRQLLTHQSGLIPDNALSDYLDGPEKAWERICALKLVGPIGESFRYSDVNFIVLGKLVERLSGKSLHDYSQEAVFQPLGMKETGFLPRKELQLRAAPTQRRENHWMRGEVHDPRAHALGGVAGHAGLFSTSRDLAIYCQTLLDGGTRGKRILSARTVQVMTGPQRVSSGIRGLGWDKQTGYSSNRGDLLTDAAFGHGGFTGTVIWIDPGLDLFFIFLSNRVHPDGKGSVNHLAGEILNRVVSAIE